MKLTAKIKLLPDNEQHEALLSTLQKTNQACNVISEIAWDKKKFRAFDIHKLCYYKIKKQFDLSAQITVRAIAKVADAYKLDKKTQRRFKKHSAIAYDPRILRYNFDESFVSIWTLQGRIKISFVSGERQKVLLENQQGESDLVYHDGKFYLCATCDIPEPDEKDIDDFLGVDFGIKKIASTSKGDFFSGSHVTNNRIRNQKLRTKLQKKGTKSAKRLLKKRSGKEYRFSQWVNHNISKAIVEKAQRLSIGIALEELTGIRDRIKARRKQRQLLHSWSFHDLRQKIVYKAMLVGVRVVVINPAYTSQMCSGCGHTSKSNRKTQSEFLCVKCSLSLNADLNAAINIRRAAINLPNVDTAIS